MSGDDMMWRLYEEATERGRLGGVALGAVRQALADHEDGGITSADTLAAVRHAMQQYDDSMDAFRRGAAEQRREAMER